MTKLKLSYFGHIVRRQSHLENIIILGEIESIKKIERLDMRWIDSIKETRSMSLEELNRTTEDRPL